MTQEILKENMDYSVQKQKDYKELSIIEYLQKIDLSKINGNDLNLLKFNFTKLFSEDIFPYTINNVLFRKGDFNRIEIIHRNRKGYLNINNGFWGRQPDGNDYYAILEACPYFTNEHSTYTRVEGKEITWNKNMLTLLSERVIRAWNRAIEENYSNRF